MRKQKKVQTEFEAMNIIDLIVYDHRFVKECIETLTDDKSDKKKKFSIAKDFLTAVELHSQAEKRAVYGPLLENEEVHFNILEANVEHGMIDKKVKYLKGLLANSRSLKEEVEVELKVLSELIKHHIMEEESELLPKMQESVDDETLMEMGLQFLKIRKMSPEQILVDKKIKSEFKHWKELVEKDSKKIQLSSWLK